MITKLSPKMKSLNSISNTKELKIPILRRKNSLSNKFLEDLITENEKKDDYNFYEEKKKILKRKKSKLKNCKKKNNNKKIKIIKIENLERKKDFLEKKKNFSVDFLNRNNFSLNNEKKIVFFKNEETQIKNNLLDIGETKINNKIKKNLDLKNLKKKKKKIKKKKI